MAEQQIERRADGTWRVMGHDGRSHVAHAVTDAEGTVWVHIAGEVLAILDESATRSRPRVHGHATLEAPMPAQVTAVLVATGDVVQAGATLMVLEAMKMELPIKAPRDGQVASVGCEAGSLVPAGTPLVQLVEDPA